MSDLKLVIPQETTNLITNPSIEEATTGYTAVVAAIARSATQQRYGVYSLRITPTAGLYDGAYYTLALTNGVTYTFSVDGYWADGVPYRIYFASAAGVILGTPTEFTGNGRWERVSVTYSAVATANHRVYVTKNGSNDTTIFYTDGWQVEALAFDTTYCDGEQPGCLWTGTPHASSSYRSGRTRLGGREVDLEDYFNVRPRMTYQGFDVPPIRLNDQALATQDGEYLQSIKITPRRLTIICIANPTETPGDFDDELSAMLKAKSDLYDAFSPDQVLDRTEPTLLRWEGPNSKVEIPVNYERGAEGNYQENCYEEFPLDMQAYDPIWRDVGNTADVLGAGSSLTHYEALGRIDGAWDALGVGARGGLFFVFAVAIGPDGYLYIGGGFTNWDGLGNADRIAYWDGTNWNALGTGAPDGNVYHILFDANGDLYACGDFSSMGGVANTRSIARWDGAAWNSVGGGLLAVGDIVHDAIFDRNGDLVIVGDFPNAPGPVAVNNIARWDGAAWNAYDSGLTITAGFAAQAIAEAPNGDIWVGGYRMTGAGAGPLAINNIAYWDGTAWNDPNGGIGDSTVAEGVNDLVFDSGGRLYAAGNFPDVNGQTTTAVDLATWNGSSWEQLGNGGGSGGADLVEAIAYSPILDELWIVGSFSELGGGQTQFPKIGIWNGSEFVDANIVLNINSGALAVCFDQYGNVYLGTSQVNGTALAADVFTVNNNGTAKTFPVITIERSGGTTATLVTLDNTTTNKKLRFNYPMVDGEIVTIDTNPSDLSIISNLRGNILSELLQGSNLSEWALLPGDNIITVLVNQTGAPTMTVTMEWQVKGYCVGFLE